MRTIFVSAFSGCFVKASRLFLLLYAALYVSVACLHAAAIPVVDAAHIAISSKNLAINTENLVTNQQNTAYTQKLMTDTIQIRADTAVIRQMQEYIAEVLHQRQLLLIEIAQLAALEEFGLVVGDPPTNDIVEEMNLILSGGNEVNPIRAGGGNKLTGKAASLTSGSLGSYTDGAGLGGRYSALASTLVNWSSAAGNLVQGIGKTIYDGTTFLGLNWSTIDNLKGYRGLPLSDDSTIPSYMFMVSPRVAAALRTAIGSSNAYGLYAMDTPEAKAARSMMAASGIFVRPQTRYDGAYHHMVQKGSAADQATFWAAVSEGVGVTYDPIFGIVPPGRSLTVRVCYNDLLTNGAFSAVGDYNARTGRTHNPYSGFARSVAAVVGQEIDALKPGQRILLTDDVVARAQTMPPVNLDSYGRLGAVDFGPENRLCEYALSISGREEYMLADTGEGAVVTATLSESEADEYTARIQASNTRLTQIQRMLNINAAMMNHCQNMHSHVKAIRDGYQAIAKKMTEMNANESINALIGQCDALMVTLQNQVAAYALEIDSLLNQQNTEQMNRTNYVTSMWDRTKLTASTRVASILAGGRVTGACAPIDPRFLPEFRRVILDAQSDSQARPRTPRL